MKKFLCVILSVAMLASLSLTGCRHDEPIGEYAGIKNVIMFIGDGMGFQHVKAGEIYMGEKSVMDGFNYKSSSDTKNSLGVITDSAAGATALACGERTQNGYVAIDKYGNGTNLKTIMDYSLEKGRSTGIVTSDYLSGATPSGFSAHAFSRDFTDEIIETQAASGVNFLAGDFSDNYEENAALFIQNGYACYPDLNGINVNKKALIVGEVEPEQNADGNYLMLDEMTAAAINYLSRDEDGFTLMVEGAYIDKHSHSNDAEGMIKNFVAFNEAVKVAVEWAKNRTDTIIIVTADHETGGLNVGAGATKDKLTSGDFSDLSWSSGDHTAERVPVFVYSPIEIDLKSFSSSGSDEYLRNVDLFLLMLSCVRGEAVTTVPVA